MQVYDEYLSLKEASKLFPGKPCKETLARWSDRGFKGIKLETKRCGRVRCVTRRAICEFIEATSEAEVHAPPNRYEKGRTPARRKLSKAGI